MMRSPVAILIAVALVGVLALAGCGEKQEAQLQGAPTAGAPTETHTMPGGQQMHGAEHPAEAGRPAATGTTGTASCPVLGTTMSKDKMIPYEYKGKTYYFCCPPCVEKFKQDPEKYLKNPAPAKPAGQGMGS